MAPHFENVTAGYVAATGSKRPEGELRHMTVSVTAPYSHGLWTLYVVETPAGDRLMVLHKDNSPILSFFPDLVTRAMFPIDKDWSTYSKLPSYVKLHIETVVRFARTVELPA